MKIYVRLRTWIMLATLPVTALVVALVMNHFGTGFGGPSMFTYMGVVQSMSSLAFLYAVVVAGDIVASEYSWGTIKLLLIRPVSRGKILLSKYVAVLLFIIVQLLLLFMSSYLIGLIMFGLGSGIDAQAGSTISRLLGEYGLDAVETVMSVSLAFMISAAFRSSVMAIVISVFLMFTAQTFVVILSKFKYVWVKYFLYANTDLSPYIYGDGQGPVPGMTLGFSVTMLVIYLVLFYFIAWLLFTKRDVAG
jgi:ABC-2 type transport system permease protein